MRVALVALLVLVLAAPRAGAADVTHVGIPKHLLGDATAPPLRVTLAFGQAALRGSTDYVSILRVVPAGNATWSGVWWSSSEAGASQPRHVDVTAQGAFVDHATSAASVQGGLVHVRYHFVGLDGSRMDYDAPPLPVLDAAPRGDAPILGGIDADADVVAFSPWNVMDHAAQMGFTLRDADGRVLHDERVGGCSNMTLPETEAGCRVPYVLQRLGAASLELWDVVDGARRVDATVALDALQG